MKGVDVHIRYLEGGNPPTAAGLFLVTPRRKRKSWKRLAWWPAGYPATNEHMEIVVAMIRRRESDDDVITREQIRDALDEYAADKLRKTVQV